MTRILTPLAVLGISICTFASAQAQVCYPAQNYYQAYQPAYSPSQSTFNYQPAINTYTPTVSTYFYTGPTVQAAPAYQPAPICQPANIVESYPPMSMLSPTPLLISSDCNGCERIKEIETKIAALKAKLGEAGTSSVQDQLDLHEKEFGRQAQEFKNLGSTITEIKQTIQILADEIQKNNKALEEKVENGGANG